MFVTFFQNPSTSEELRIKKRKADEPPLDPSEVTIHDHGYMGPNSATTGDKPPSAKRRKIMKKRGRPRTSVNARNLRVSIMRCLV